MVFDFIQLAKTLGGITNTTISCIFTNPVVAGNSIIVTVFCYSETSSPVVSDNSGSNIYNELGSGRNTFHQYLASNVAGGSAWTVSASYTTSSPPGHMSIWATEYEGNLVWDVGRQGNIGSTTLVYDSGVTGATSHANELIYGTAAAFNANIFSAGPPWTPRINNLDDGNVFAFEYDDHVVSSTGTQQFTGGCDSSGFTFATVDAFYEFSGGATNPSRLSSLGVG